MSKKCCSSKHKQRRRGKLKIYDISGFIWVPNFNGLGRFQDGYRLNIGHDYVEVNFIPVRSGYSCPYHWVLWNGVSGDTIWSSGRIRGKVHRDGEYYKSFKAAMKAAVQWVVNSNIYSPYI